jgi:hypothetical protein
MITAQMGYKQELRRHYSTTQVFAIAFSIMALLPSIASTLSFSMPAGPVGMVWVSILTSYESFFVPGSLLIPVGYVSSEDLFRLRS